MCFDAKSSMEAFIISSLGISMLYFSGDKTKQKISYFWLSVTLIQLWEYFIWKNIDNKEKNRFWTTILRINISLQPLIALLVLISLPNYLPKELLLGILMIVIIVVINWIYNIFNKPIEITKVNNNSNLKWKGSFTDQTQEIIPTMVYFLALTILPWFIKPFKTGITFGMLIIFSILLTFLKSENYDIINNSGWKSLWCYSASLIPILQYVLT